ncbi:DoxX family protein [Azohydromonas aeria]|uniref:DoxX family protein n=1 Tax=Azohydromonas aeria TaxID=2590212 RepID=UPI0012FAFC76|nr:DoxX family protein [Azohydromonas aeria]
MANPHPVPNSAVTSATEDTGKLVLRVALGVLVLMHGIAKVISGPGSALGLLAKAGLPTELAYGVYIGEVVAPMLLIAGLFTRAAALIVVINMLFAIGLAHMAQLGQLTKTGGWALELQGMYLFGALAVALLGAGRYSVGGLHGRWN